MFRRTVLRARMDDEWSFEYKGRERTALAAFSDWLGILADSHDGEATDEPKRNPVGFSRTPHDDLGECRADTDLETVADDE